MINLSTHPYQPNGLSIDSLELLSSFGTLEVCYTLIFINKSLCYVALFLLACLFRIVVINIVLYYQLLCIVLFRCIFRVRIVGCIKVIPDILDSRKE
jgi:hypothetical protein